MIWYGATFLQEYGQIPIPIPIPNSGFVSGNVKWLLETGFEAPIPALIPSEPEVPTTLTSTIAFSAHRSHHQEGSAVGLYACLILNYHSNGYLMCLVEANCITLGFQARSFSPLDGQYFISESSPPRVGVFVLPVNTYFCYLNALQAALRPLLRNGIAAGWG